MTNLRTQMCLGLLLTLAAALSWPAPGIKAQVGRPRASLETEFGLQTAIFETPGGRVTLRLPDDLRAGDVVSGTIAVSVPPKSFDGQPPSHDLQQCVLEFAGQQTPASRRIAKWLVPAGAKASLALILRNGAGSEISRVLIPISAAAHGQRNGNDSNSGKVYYNNEELPPGRELEVTNFPDKAGDKQGAKPGAVSRVANPVRNPAAILYGVAPFAQAGRPIAVEGLFDGDLGTTRVRIADQPVDVIAESPRKIVVETPRNLIGPVEILVEKQGNAVAECPCRSIGVRMSVAKRNLDRGEQTPISVTLTGLGGVDAGFTLRLTNKSPATVELEGGDSQTLAVEPRQIRQESYTTSRLLTGIQPGGFEVGAVIERGPMVACRQKKGADAVAVSGSQAGAGDPGPVTDGSDGLTPKERAAAAARSHTLTGRGGLKLTDRPASGSGSVTTTDQGGLKLTDKPDAGPASVTTTDQGGLKLTDKPAAAGSLTLTDQGGLKLTDRPAPTVVPADPTVQPARTASVVPAGPTSQPARTATIQPAPPNRGPNLSSSGWSAHDPQIAASGENVYVTWVLEMPGNPEIFVARSTDRGLSFAPAINLSGSPGQSLNPKIAVLGDRVSVVWEDNFPGNFDIFYSLSLDRGASWSAPMNVSANRGNSRDPQVAFFGIDPVFAWVDDSSGTKEILFRSSRSSSTVSVSNTTTNIFRRLSPSNARSPKIGVSDENIYAVWEDNPLGDYDVYFARSVDKGESFQRAGFANSSGRWVAGIWSDYGDQFNAQAAALGNSIYIVYEDDRPGLKRVHLLLSSDDGNSLFDPDRRPESFGHVILNGDRAIENVSEVRVGDRVPISPQVAADGSSSYFAWDQYTCHVATCFRQISFGARIAGRFRPVSSINTEGDARLPQIALYGGHQFVIFQMAQEAGRQSDIFVWDSRTLGSRNISNTVGDSLKPKVAVSVGNLVVVWEENTGGHQQIYFGSTPAH